jgi:hypothetical protein
MEKYKVWDIVDQQDNMRVVGARLVYTRKIDGTTGLSSTYRARWLQRASLKLRVSTTTYYMQLWRTRTQFECFYLLSTILTWNATEWTLLLRLSTVIYQRQSTWTHLKDQICQITRFSDCTNHFTVSSNHLNVSTRPLTNGLKTRTSKQQRSIPVYTPVCQAMGSASCSLSGGRSAHYL